MGKRGPNFMNVYEKDLPSRLMSGRLPLGTCKDDSILGYAFIFLQPTLVPVGFLP
jgi:hypothetical protein